MRGTDDLCVGSLGIQENVKRGFKSEAPTPATMNTKQGKGYLGQNIALMPLVFAFGPHKFEKEVFFIIVDKMIGAKSFGCHETSYPRYFELKDKFALYRL